jgi:hypothetical protein
MFQELSLGKGRRRAWVLIIRGWEERSWKAWAPSVNESMKVFQYFRSFGVNENTSEENAHSRSNRKKSGYENLLDVAYKIYDK